MKRRKGPDPRGQGPAGEGGLRGARRGGEEGDGDNSDEGREVGDARRPRRSGSGLERGSGRVADMGRKDPDAGLRIGPSAVGASHRAVSTMRMPAGSHRVRLVWAASRESPSPALPGPTK